MPDLLRSYIDARKLPMRGGNEEILNTVLESLQKERENFADVGYKHELISSCAVALNGLGKIKDPVRLFKNLGLAFEYRDYCIYTDTVINAFNRSYKDAVKQKKGNEVFAVWKSFRNPLTKANVGRYVPLEKLKELLSHSNDSVREAASKALVRRPDFPLSELNGLLSHGDKSVRDGAAYALPYRKDVPLSELKKLASNPKD